MFHILAEDFTHQAIQSNIPLHPNRGKNADDPTSVISAATGENYASDNPKRIRLTRQAGTQGNRSASRQR
jgi:hypothetical protein